MWTRRPGEGRQAETGSPAGGADLRGRTRGRWTRRRSSSRAGAQVEAGRQVAQGRSGPAERGRRWSGTGTPLLPSSARRTTGRSRSAWADAVLGLLPELATSGRPRRARRSRLRRPGGLVISRLSRLGSARAACLRRASLALTSSSPAAERPHLSRSGMHPRHPRPPVEPMLRRCPPGAREAERAAAPPAPVPAAAALSSAMSSGGSGRRTRGSPACPCARGCCLFLGVARCRGRGLYGRPLALPTFTPRDRARGRSVAGWRRRG